MNYEINNNYRKLSSRLLFLGTLTLLIVLVIPWISIVDHDLQFQLFLNSVMMERSDNNKIKEFANYIIFITYLLWIFIFVNLISYICYNIYSFEKYPRFVKLLTHTSYVSLIISTSITYLQINLIKKIVQTDDVSLVSIFSIIKFAYIPLIISFLSLIFSIIYTSSVIKSTLNYRRIIKIKTREINRELLIEEPEKLVEKETFYEKIIPDFKHIKSRDWLDEEDKQKIYSNVKSDLEFLKSKELFKIKNNVENKLEKQNNFVKTDEKINLEPIETKEYKTDLNESSKKIFSQEFGKKLDTINMYAPCEIKDEKKELKKKINIRCPKCKFVFPFKKDENIIKVKCPNCGKEGTIKYLDEIAKHLPQS